MEEAKFRFTIIGLGTEAVAIALFQVYDKPPTWILWTIMAVGFVLIVYGLSSFPFTGLRRLLIYYPFWEPKVSVTREQGITLAARLRWHDDVGRPLVAADEKSGLVRNVWAALDIEVRNHTQSKQRITELYLEVRHAVPWKFRRLIAEADPVAIDRDIHWYEKQFPRRVEWELEPVSAPLSYHVRFDRCWMPGEGAPRDPKTFSVSIVAELGTSSIPVRLLLGKDVWRTGEVPK